MWITSMPGQRGTYDMQARKVLAGAAYEPATLKVICRAFDDAWAEIRHYFDDPLAAECARLKLANAILGVAREDSRDAADLKKKGLHALALRHSVDSAAEVAMGQRTRNSRYWRAYAEETLTIAEQMTNSECKRMLAGVAETYTQLARHAAAAEARRAVSSAQKR
jgi:hypothetical protein